MLTPEQHQDRDSTGKLWRWEILPATGCPWPVRKDGELYIRLPGERSRFWEAVAIHGNAPCIDATLDTKGSRTMSERIDDHHALEVTYSRRWKVMADTDRIDTETLSGRLLSMAEALKEGEFDNTAMTCKLAAERLRELEIETDGMFNTYEESRERYLYLCQTLGLDGNGGTWDLLKAYKKLQAEVERLGDCERIAWAMANTIRGEFKSVCLTIMADKQGEHGQWSLCKMGRAVLFCKRLGPRDQPPKLNNDARRLIDADMEAARPKGWTL